jgi:hypothetical protein
MRSGNRGYSDYADARNASRAIKKVTSMPGGRFSPRKAPDPLARRRARRPLPLGNGQQRTARKKKLPQAGQEPVEAVESRHISPDGGHLTQSLPRTQRYSAKNFLHFAGFRMDPQNPLHFIHFIISLHFLVVPPSIAFHAGIAEQKFPPGRGTLGPRQINPLRLSANYYLGPLRSPADARRGSTRIDSSPGIDRPRRFGLDACLGPALSAIATRRILSNEPRGPTHSLRRTSR